VGSDAIGKFVRETEQDTSVYVEQVIEAVPLPSVIRLDPPNAYSDPGAVAKHELKAPAERPIPVMLGERRSDPDVPLLLASSLDQATERRRTTRRC
jgi:hypothetical protein